jgi:hypothetical protein
VAPVDCVGLSIRDSRGVHQIPSDDILGVAIRTRPVLGNFDIIRFFVHLCDFFGQFWKLITSNIAKVIKAEPALALDFDEPWHTFHTEENPMARALHKYRGIAKRPHNFLGNTSEEAEGAVRMICPPYFMIECGTPDSRERVVVKCDDMLQTIAAALIVPGSRQLPCHY